MRKGGSRRKGHDFERKVASLFTKWTGHEWIRTPQSGGMPQVTKADLFSKELYNSKQDIIFVECKKRKSMDMGKILTGKCAEFKSWMTKLYDNAIKEKKIPILVFSYNRSDVFVATFEQFVSIREKVDSYDAEILRAHVNDKAINITTFINFVSIYDFNVLYRLHLTYCMVWFPKGVGDDCPVGV